MNLNYAIIVDFLFLYVKYIKHQTLVAIPLLTSIYIGLGKVDFLTSSLFVPVLLMT